MDLYRSRVLINCVDISTKVKYPSLRRCPGEIKMTVRKQAGKHYLACLGEKHVEEVKHKWRVSAGTLGGVGWIGNRGTD